MVSLFKESKMLHILRIFFLNPDKKFTIRELARTAKISPAWVSKIVSGLKKEGYLDTDETRRIKANLEFKDFLRLKKVFNLRNLYESGLIDYLTQEYHQPECISLFGSHSTAEDSSRSDIDIAVITNKKLSLDLLQFEKFLARKINIHEIVLRKSSSEFKNSLINGIVLHGYLEVL